MSDICGLGDNPRCNLKIATEDGSFENQGLATDLLIEELNKAKAPIYTCGPIAMMFEVVKIAKKFEVGCYVSLEERMACGIGACQGCVLPTRTGYKRVCADGPVFNADDLEWEVEGD
jgi:dihydroorotate dehydrogenase electron transfer subunit